MALPRDVAHPALLRTEVQGLSPLFEAVGNVFRHIGAATGVAMQRLRRCRRLIFHPRRVHPPLGPRAENPPKQPNRKNDPEDDLYHSGEEFHVLILRSPFLRMALDPTAPQSKSVAAVYARGKSSVNGNHRKKRGWRVLWRDGLTDGAEHLFYNTLIINTLQVSVPEWNRKSPISLRARGCGRLPYTDAKLRESGSTRRAAGSSRPGPPRCGRRPGPSR